MMTIILRGKHGEYEVRMHRTHTGMYTATESGDGARPEGPCHWDSTNPLETFNSMLMRVEAVGRAAIGDWFEQTGKNRYTGAPETKE